MVQKCKLHIYNYIKKWIYFVYIFELSFILYAIYISQPFSVINGINFLTNYSVTNYKKFYDYYCNQFPEIPKKHNAIEDMTFITIPYPLKNRHHYMTMKLSISSWLSLSDKTRVLLFICQQEFDKTGQFTSEIEKIFGKNRLIFIGDVCSNSKGIPLINEWFIQGIKQSSSKYVTFINSDIVISPKWWKTVKKILTIPNFSEKPFVILARRLNVRLNYSKINGINFSRYKKKPFKLLKILDSIILNSTYQKLSSKRAIDIFTFRADEPPFNPTDIPPFLIGRYAWDNWIFGYLNKYCDTVFLGKYGLVYHIEHKHHNHTDQSSEYQFNLRLYKSNIIARGNMGMSKWIVNKSYIVNNRNKDIKIKY